MRGAMIRREWGSVRLELGRLRLIGARPTVRVRPDIRPYLGIRTSG